MKRVISIACLVLLMAAASFGTTLPGPTVGDGLGVNIHFVGNQARDLDMIRDGGFKFIRMDFAWSSIERTKGVYDFSEYDSLVDGLSSRGLRALFILDYGNALYDPSAVTSDEGRQAFARWAVESVKRYKGRGVIWELWNEPNGFWEPRPSQGPYMKLVNVAIPAIHKADPSAVCIAPAVAWFDFDWIEKCFKDGLLDVTDAFSCHPYRNTAVPETAEKDYRKLRALMARYRPDGRELPVVSGEWGYSDVQEGLSQKVQGEYIARMYLTNLSCGIPLTIWYDWKDDGSDPKNKEHHFGSMTLDLSPKPAYTAVKRLTTELRGMHFIKRLHSRENDYLLLFGDGKRTKIAAWSTDAPHRISLPGSMRIGLTAEPEYYLVDQGNKAALAEASWSAVPSRSAVLSGVGIGDPMGPAFTVEVRNPFGHAVTIKASAVPVSGMEGRFVDGSTQKVLPGQSVRIRWAGRILRRDLANTSVRVAVEMDGMVSRQDIVFGTINPISMGIEPSGKGGVSIAIEDNARVGFKGEMSVTAGSKPVSIQIEAADGWKNVSASTQGRKIQTSLLEDGRLRLLLPIKGGLSTPTRSVLKVGGVVAADSGALRMEIVSTGTETVQALDDGDLKVGARFSLKDEPNGILRFDYEYDAGWKVVRISPKKSLPLPGKPHEMGVWVNGDGSGLAVNMQFIDGMGRTHQPTLGILNFKGWRFLRAPMDDPTIPNWGEIGSVCKLTYPIRLETFMLADGNGSPAKGSVEMKDFAFFYRE